MEREDSSNPHRTIGAPSSSSIHRRIVEWNPQSRGGISHTEGDLSAGIWRSSSGLRRTKGPERLTIGDEGNLALRVKDLPRDERIDGSA
jgi:hypothetical protein